MGATETTTLATRLIEDGFGHGDLDVFDEIMSPDSVGHAPPDELHGPEAVKAFVTELRTGFPDLSFEIRDLIADDDRVAVRWMARGTHEGPFQGIQPTGRSIELGGVTVEHVEDGRIVEGWTYRDALGMLAQLGALPDGGMPPGPE